MNTISNYTVGKPNPAYSIPLSNALQGLSQASCAVMPAMTRAGYQQIILRYCVYDWQLLSVRLSYHHCGVYSLQH